MAWFHARGPRKKNVKTLVILFVFVVLLTFFTSRTSKPTRIQHKFRRKSLVQTARQDAVKREFLHAWTAYKDHAWMADGLMPLSGSRKQQFCGWSATLVDSLDTLYLMELDAEFEEAVNATLTIDFTAGDCMVNLFESTIRYLGGLMAAYDLSNDARLLPQLVQLGNMLHSAFRTPNGMPCTHCQLGGKGPPLMASSSAPLADVGSLYLEFARLSQITGDDKYMKTVNLLSHGFARAQNRSSIAGLWPEIVIPLSTDGPNADFSRASYRYSLGALSDSAYEYLVKTHLLLGKKTKIYESMWKAASKQIKRHLLFRAFIPHGNETDAIFAGIATRRPDTNQTMLETRTEHLACFAGGMFAMASRIFNNPHDLYIGQQITNGCVWAYRNSPTGIMPEAFTALPCSDTDDFEGTQQCGWNESYWDQESRRPEHCLQGDCEKSIRFPPGFLQVSDPSYKLRPEAIESVFIMWRMTGDEYWRDVGWSMFESIVQHTRSPFGHAALLSTMEVFDQDRYDRGLMVRKVLARRQDDMESFWFAETLKYFYLLFSEPSLLSLDDWVLNTEAHPFRLSPETRGF
ncbi:putative mannosyl-oligosaccharide alpha-1,2-mannosidase 1B [Exophiala dermatitidis]